MRSLIRSKRIRDLEKRYLPEERTNLRLVWGDEEDGSAYGIDLVWVGEERRSISWRQDDETRPPDVPPPPPEYWARLAEEEGHEAREAEQEPRDKGPARTRIAAEEPTEPDPVMRDHLRKFEKPQKGTPWDEKHRLATTARKGRPALRYSDGGEQWPVVNR